MVEQKVKRIPWYKVWTQVFIDYNTRNKSENSEARDYNLYASTNALFSGLNNVTYLYTLDGYPEEVPLNLHEELRSVTKGNVRMSFITQLDPTSIDWKSARITSKLNTWKRTDEEGEDVNAYNVRETGEKARNMDRRRTSLLYLNEAESERKSKLFVNRTLILISGTRGAVFDKTIEEFEALCKGLDLTVNRVNTQIESYLRSFSPFTMEMQEAVRKEVGNTTIPDEVAARLVSYTHGKVGNGSFYMGTDILSNYAVTKNFKENTTDAENMLIVGETGSGKSYYVKVLAFQLIVNSKFNGTIMDVEGDEYLPLANYIENSGEQVVVLNMSEGQGLYYDPLELIPSGDPDIDKDIYTTAVSTAKNIYSAVINIDGFEGNSKHWARTYIDLIVSELYSRRGITNSNRNSWARSKGLTLHEGYRILEEMQKRIATGDYRGASPGELDQLKMLEDNHGTRRETFDLVYLSMKRYFAKEEEGGTFSSVFSKRVSLRDISDAKLVVCSFGMAGKADTLVDPTQAALSQIFAARISHIRSLYSKREGLYNFKIWEEFQRWGKFEGSESTIRTSLTGGRKLGDVQLIVTNDLRALMDNDKANILQNIQSYALGAVGDAATREDFAARYQLEDFLEQWGRIETPNSQRKRGGLADDDSDDGLGNGEVFNSQLDIGGSSSNSAYRRAFIVNLDRFDKTVVKMKLPADISDSDIFKTGVDIGQSVEDISNSDIGVEW